jgi:hypothetical protein
MLVLWSIVHNPDNLSNHLQFDRESSGNYDIRCCKRVLLYNDRQKKQTYIFFDFECTQDDRIQCQQGYQSDDNENCIHYKSPRCGAFDHKPNLCVVHRVCLKCMDQGVDKDSICQTCGKNELVFAGPNTTEHFWRGHRYCTQFQRLWFIAHTVIAHNFKGYDSLPILGYLYQNDVKPTIIANGAKNMYIEVPGLIGSLSYWTNVGNILSSGPPIQTS